MPPEIPQEKIGHINSSNDKILDTFDVKPGKTTVGHIADALKIKPDKLKELFGNTHFSGIYQKDKKGIKELKDPKGFFFSEPRIDDIYALNHTNQGYTLHRIRNNKEFIMLIPSEYIILQENNIHSELAKLSKEVRGNELGKKQIASK